MSEQRRQLLQKLSSATSLSDQRDIVNALDQLDREAALQIEEERSVDWVNTAVGERMRPTAVHTLHTEQTDWMNELQTTGSEDYSNKIHAEASLWYNRVDGEVKADATEFAEQARGMARRASGGYGERAEAAEKEFLSYVAFLWKRQAASGLDQIDQLFDAHDNYRPTGFDPEVFDNFAPSVHPINEWTQEESGSGPAVDSDRPSRAQDVGGAQSSGGENSEHSTSDDHSESATNENWPESLPSGPSGQSSNPSEHSTENDVAKKASLSLSLWDTLDDE